jgi:aspartate-alanine antiporter
MDWAQYILKAAPEIALFVALALGHALGRLKLGGFNLGGVAGSLIVALVVGQFTGVELPDALKAVCFALFIYAVGFKSGPEFFGGLNRSSIKLVVSSVVHCTVSLVLILAFAKVCGFGKGFAAGLGAGALTQTAMIGTAGDALQRLDITPEQKSLLGGQMAVSFAITYVFGTVGVILFARLIAPRLLGVNVKQAARELEQKLSEGGEISRPGFITPFVPVVARAFEVGAGKGKTVDELTKQFGRASIERILRGDKVVEPTASVTLHAGDKVGIAGRLEDVIAAGGLVGNEIEKREALSFAVKAVTVVITKKRVTGRTLGEVRSILGEAQLHGVYLSSLKRQGFKLPVLIGTKVQRGDVVELVGRPDQVDRVAALIGSAESGGGASDLAYHALAMFVGTLIGLITVAVGGIPVTLGVGGGVLVAGLCFGWWHARYPVHGALPAPAQLILTDFGLSAFAAVIGLSAGPRAVAAIQAHGIAVLLAGVAVTIVPLVAALYFGRFVLKLHPVILLGAIVGGQTVAAALNAVTEETESMTPVLGFTVTYAISNVLLAVWGPVVVAFA